jgi:hypothetical protein
VRTSLWVDSPYMCVRGASYYGCGVERTSEKLPLRRQGRSPLKYINYRRCISLEEKKFVCLTTVWVFITIVDNFSSTGQTFGPKNPKKCCHVDVLKILVYWPLASSVKAERTNFGSPPNKLIKSLVCSTDGRSVKCP